MCSVEEARPSGPDAVMVKSASTVLPQVPLITPEKALMRRPAGRAGATENTVTKEPASRGRSVFTVPLRMVATSLATTKEGAWPPTKVTTLSTVVSGRPASTEL